MHQINQSSSMDVETAIRTLASAGHNLPREAMRWALDHWDGAAPDLLGVLERFADGTDRSEEAVGAAFFILHLAAERRETRAFAPLCRLLRDPEALEEVLGDGVTTTLKRILIGTYDGDLEALKGVIEAEEVDEYARAGALEVLAYLAATGRGSPGRRRKPTCSTSMTCCGRSTRASSGTAGPRRSRCSGSRRCPTSSGGRSGAA